METEGGIEGDRWRQVDTDRDRERQMETDKDRERQAQTETDEDKWRWKGGIEGDR